MNKIIKRNTPIYYPPRRTYGRVLQHRYGGWYDILIIDYPFLITDIRGTFCPIADMQEPYGREIDEKKIIIPRSIPSLRKLKQKLSNPFLERSFAAPPIWKKDTKKIPHISIVETDPLYKTAVSMMERTLLPTNVVPLTFKYQGKRIDKRRPLCWAYYNSDFDIVIKQYSHYVQPLSLCCNNWEVAIHEFDPRGLRIIKGNLVDIVRDLNFLSLGL